MFDIHLERLLILGVAIGLSIPIALFPFCSYRVNVGNMNLSGASPLPLWVALRDHQIQRAQMEESYRTNALQQRKYEYVVVAWYWSIQCLVLLWGCSLGVLFYRQALRLSDRSAAYWYVLWRTGLTGCLLGGVIVPGIALLEPWARALPSHNPFLSVSPIMELAVASILTLITAGLGAVVGLIAGGILGKRAGRLVTHPSLSTTTCDPG